MRISLFLVTIFALAQSVAFADPRCVCNAYNLSRCEGTGPTLQSYLWSDESQQSQWFDVTIRYGVASPAECQALSYVAVPRDVPVFNYYGNLVHGCIVVWKNCGVADYHE